MFVFTVTCDQSNASLLSRNINFLNKNKIFNSENPSLMNTNVMVTLKQWNGIQVQ